MSDEAQKPEIQTPPTEDEINLAMLQKSVETGSFKLPEQFKTPEDFLNSYKQLQGHATKVTQELAKLKPSEEAPAAPVTEPIADMGAAVSAPPNEAVADKDGIKWDEVNAELLKSGDLSVGTRAALRNANIPDDLVDTKVRDHKRQMKEDATAAADLVGGAESLKDLLGWANKSLEPEDAAVVSRELRGDNWKLTLMGLKTMRESTQPNVRAGEPLVSVEGGPASSENLPHIAPFTSNVEMTAAIRDPKYTTDSEYRRAVQERIIQSNMVNARTVRKGKSFIPQGM